jgi:hypothetical protein
VMMMMFSVLTSGVGGVNDLDDREGIGADLSGRNMEDAYSNGVRHRYLIVYRACNDLRGLGPTSGGECGGQ